MDEIAFMDDNPAEGERIRTQLPQVTVIDLANSPSRVTYVRNRFREIWRNGSYVVSARELLESG